MARVNIGCEARPSMRIWLNAPKLAAFSLTPGDVETALRTQNIELPAGRFESASQNVTVRVNRPFGTAQQFSQLVVGRGTDGYRARLGDVARIQPSPQNPKSASRSQRKQGGCIAVNRP